MKLEYKKKQILIIFKRAGLLNKLQKTTEYPSINVSLTYLRRLEVAELTEEDIPNPQSQELSIFFQPSKLYKII